MDLEVFSTLGLDVWQALFGTRALPGSSRGGNCSADRARNTHVRCRGGPYFEAPPLELPWQLIPSGVEYVQPDTARRLLPAIG